MKRRMMNARARNEKGNEKSKGQGMKKARAWNEKFNRLVSNILGQGMKCMQGKE
jgi:hypothetical protein